MTNFKHTAWQLLILVIAFAMSSNIELLAGDVRFGTDVVPILTKLGCDSGGCHGKATGQNGFKLSLFGFEPEVDYDALVTEARGRRLTLADPDRSLLLLKATSRVPHGGGRRLNESSDDYRILCDPVAQLTVAHCTRPRRVRRHHPADGRERAA